MVPWWKGLSRSIVNSPVEELKLGPAAPYTVRESPRARYVRLKLSVRDGLVVVVPKGFDRRRIPGLLEQKQRWIEKASEKIERQRDFLRAGAPDSLPERILLRAIGEEWSVSYQSTGAARVAAVEREGHRLHVYGNTGNVPACREALARWMNRKAHERLVPWLEQIAREKGFHIGRVLVRSQKTRWGSCSRRGTISLNQNLLFVPPDLAQYVFLHELCHTVHLNHSARFWALLRQYSASYKELHRELRAAWQMAPAWTSAGQNGQGGGK